MTAVLLVATVVILGIAFAVGFRAGGNAARKTAAERDRDAAKRISDARAAAPSDADAVAERLRRDGKL